MRTARMNFDGRKPVKPSFWMLQCYVQELVIKVIECVKEHGVLDAVDAVLEAA